MAITVLKSPEFSDWRETLSPLEGRSVDLHVELLATYGYELGMPHSKKLKGAKINLRELRPTAVKVEIRVFYVFDPERSAILLTGGSKSGSAKNAEKWYKRQISRATRIASRYGVCPKKK